MVDIWLPYGKTEVCLRVPTSNLLKVIEPNDRTGAETPQAVIEDALKNPFGTKLLSGMAKPGDKVALVLKYSGASTNNFMISGILKELNSAGVREEDVTLIVACDPLRVSERTELPLLSDDLSAGIRIKHHNFETDECVEVGKTSRGTEVHLNEAYVKADVKILAGVIEPHPYAGYSGGREGVLPGIANLRTVQRNLSLGLDAKAKRGTLEGNPVHEDMVEAARLAEVDFSLNVVRNSRLEVVRGFAGDLTEAFGEGVKLVDEMCKIPIESRADVVSVSPGGFPFDIDLFEASKAIDSPLEVAKKDKIIVLVAECTNGFGANEFYETICRFKTAKALEKDLKRRFSVAGLVAYRLMRALESVTVYLVSAMPDYQVSKALGLKTARTANEALGYALDAVGKNGRVSVITHGNWTMPVVKAADREQG